MEAVELNLHLGIVGVGPAPQQKSAQMFRVCTCGLHGLFDARPRSPVHTCAYLSQEQPLLLQLLSRLGVLRLQLLAVFAPVFRVACFVAVSNTVGDTRKHTPWTEFQCSVTPHQARF